ncbi:hypothetical protein BTVI_145515 [Pitangus sulphuratus]|nr:hypothetical protein BTVI_145515 [Pitangus sulphuratus]
MLAGRAPPGAAGCGRLLAAALRPLLCGLSPCWAAGRQCRGLRVAEAAAAAAAEKAQVVKRRKRSGVPSVTGPGILTQTLLNAGIRVVALENDLAYLPNLQSLENNLDGKLKVIYGDFCRLDPLILKAKPGTIWAYQPLTVLAQIGFEIELLHMEPWSSFTTNLKSGNLAVPKSKWLPNDHLCLVRLTPQKNLFTGGLKPTNATTFIFMVKQCLAKPTSRLSDRLNSWSLDNGGELLKALEIPENAIMRDLYPEDYRRLFETLQNSSMFTETWFYDEVSESVRTINL